MFHLPVSLSPEEFESFVADLLQGQSIDVSDFTVTKREVIETSDGDYEIDIAIRFEILGVSITMLVECKHHKNPIKREVAQILFEKLRSTGAQKGLIVSIARYQKGAIGYAQTHGIALVQVTDGRLIYHTRSYGPTSYPDGVPRFVGWLVIVGQNGNESYSSLLPKTRAVLRPKPSSPRVPSRRLGRR